MRGSHSECCWCKRSRLGAGPLQRRGRSSHRAIQKIKDLTLEEKLCSLQKNKRSNIITHRLFYFLDFLVFVFFPAGEDAEAKETLPF
mmetsp:Transcript_7564/g.13204  ORF Transcript_7564/g.13204 Transcript_7564/m.13204 type:complete len:87 (+) Transcript_7564:1262-1522(+)